MAVSTADVIISSNIQKTRGLICGLDWEHDGARMKHTKLIVNVIKQDCFKMNISHSQKAAALGRITKNILH